MNKQLRTLNRDISSAYAIVRNPNLSELERDIAQQTLDALLAEREELYASEAAGVDRNERRNVRWSKRKADVLGLLLVLSCASTQACLSQQQVDDPFEFTYTCDKEPCVTNPNALSGAVSLAVADIKGDSRRLSDSYSVISLTHSNVVRDEIQVLVGVDAVYTVEDSECPFDTEVSLYHTALHMALLTNTGSLDSGHRDAVWSKEADANLFLMNAYCR